MRYAVVDLELNQPSNCIIEIGAVCWDARQSKILSSFKTLVRLPDNEKVSEYITNLTGITQERLDHEDSLSLQAALTTFSTWAVASGCSKFMAAWGNDHWMIKQACEDTGAPFPWNCFLDVKSMATVMRTKTPGKARGGLKSALTAFGLEFVGEPHRALDDATNTALLLTELLRGTILINSVKAIMKYNV